jgi:hypothetical protein
MIKIDSDFKPTFFQRIGAWFGKRNIKKSIDDTNRRIKKLMKSIQEIDGTIEDLRFYRDKLNAKAEAHKAKLQIYWGGK